MLSLPQGTCAADACPTRSHASKKPCAEAEAPKAKKAAPKFPVSSGKDHKKKAESSSSEDSSSEEEEKPAPKKASPKKKAAPAKKAESSSSEDSSSSEEEEKKPGGEFPSYVKFSTFAFDSNVNAFYRDASWSSIRKE